MARRVPSSPAPPAFVNVRRAAKPCASCVCARARLNALPVEIAAAPRASSRRETEFREREIERINETRVVESRRVEREVKKGQKERGEKSDCFEYPFLPSILAYAL